MTVSVVTSPFQTSLTARVTCMGSALLRSGESEKSYTAVTVPAKTATACSRAASGGGGGRQLQAAAGRGAPSSAKSIRNSVTPVRAGYRRFLITSGDHTSPGAFSFHRGWQRPELVKQVAGLLGLRGGLARQDRLQVAPQRAFLTLPPAIQLAAGQDDALAAARRQATDQAAEQPVAHGVILVHGPRLAGRPALDRKSTRLN